MEIDRQTLAAKDQEIRRLTLSVVESGKRNEGLVIELIKIKRECQSLKTRLNDREKRSGVAIELTEVNDHLI